MTDPLTEKVVAAVQEVCEDPALDRRGTYAHGQRALGKRVMRAIERTLEEAECQRMQLPTSPPKA